MADELFDALHEAGLLDKMEDGDKPVALCGGGPDHCLKLHNGLGIRVTGEPELDAALQQVANAVQGAFNSTAPYAAYLAEQHYGGDVAVAIRVTGDEVAFGFVRMPDTQAD